MRVAGRRRREPARSGSRPAAFATPRVVRMTATPRRATGRRPTSATWSRALDRGARACWRALRAARRATGAPARPRPSTRRAAFALDALVRARSGCRRSSATSCCCAPASSSTRGFAAAVAAAQGDPARAEPTFGARARGAARTRTGARWPRARRCARWRLVELSPAPGSPASAAAARRARPALPRRHRPARRARCTDRAGELRRDPPTRRRRRPDAVARAARTGAARAAQVRRRRRRARERRRSRRAAARRWRGDVRSGSRMPTCCRPTRRARRAGATRRARGVLAQRGPRQLDARRRRRRATASTRSRCRVALVGPRREPLVGLAGRGRRVVARRVASKSAPQRGRAGEERWRSAATGGNGALDRASPRSSTSTRGDASARRGARAQVDRARPGVGALWDALPRAPRAPARRARAADRAGRRVGRPRAPRCAARTLREIAVHVRHRIARATRTGASPRRAARGLGISALFAGAERHRQDDGRRGARARAAARPATASTSRAVVSKYIGETEKNLRRRVRRGRGERRDPAVRRGRRAVRQAHRGQGQPRPLRQHRGQLPAAADGGLPRPRDPDHEPEAARSTRRSCAGSASSSSSRSPTPSSAPRSGAASSRRARRPTALDLARLARLDVAGGNIRNIALQRGVPRRRARTSRWRWRIVARRRAHRVRQAGAAAHRGRDAGWA